MPSRNVQFQHDTVYHVYNRWFQKQQIFFSDEDYDRFFQTVARYLQEFPEISLFAFCFLPNHFHFLVMAHEIPDGPPAQSSISSFFRRIQQSYAMYLKGRYEQDIIPRWQVYEGRFRCKVVDEDEYFSQVVRYIENNAVRHEIVADVSDWKWTSAHCRQFCWHISLVSECLFERDISSLVYVMGRIRFRLESGLQNILSPDSIKKQVRTRVGLG